jgi:motility quorum-sensing regulator / GCU-specific mRNA interferase toxin
MSAAQRAEELGLDEQLVVDVIAGLTPQDFDKSMPSDADPATRQDVYKPVVRGRELYVKFTRDGQGDLLLISFKENEPGKTRETTPMLSKALKVAGLSTEA